MKSLRSINTESRVPRHLQAWRILSEAIRNGTFPHGMRLPDSREIAVRMKASLVTTRRAIARLVKEGAINRHGPTLVVTALSLDRSMQTAPSPRYAASLNPADQQPSDMEGEYELVGARYCE